MAGILALLLRDVVLLVSHDAERTLIHAKLRLLEPVRLAHLAHRAPLWPHRPTESLGRVAGFARLNLRLVLQDPFHGVCVAVVKSRLPPR